MWMRILVFLPCLWFGGAKDCEINMKGPLDEIIKSVLESLKPNLANLSIQYQDFVTGPQEFGNLEGHVKNVVFTNLSNFAITKLETSLINIRNLSLVFEEFNLNGLYDINGTLAFPLGRNDIHFFGAGNMRMTFTNFSVSVKLIFKLEDGLKRVSDLQINLDLKGMHVNMSNLMSEEDLEKVFNQIINDVGLTVFNYYKNPIVDAIKPEIIKKIEKFLNSSEFFI